MLKGLDVREADVAAQRPATSQLDVLSETVEEGSRELLVQSHIVRTETYDAVGVATAEAGCHVNLVDIAAVGHEVDSSVRVNVHQTYFVVNGVMRDVDQTHLPALGMGHSDVKEAHLCTVERIGVVVDRHLCSRHLARCDVGEGRQLKTAFQTHRDIVEASKLYALHRCCGDIRKASQLQSFHLTDGGRGEQAELHALYRILHTCNTYGPTLCLCVYAHCHHDGNRNYS